MAKKEEREAPLFVHFGNRHQICRYANLVDDRCGAAVLRPRTFVRAGGYRTFLAVGDNTNTGRVDALRQQKVARGGTAAFAKGEVVLSRAALVTMAFNGHGQ